MDGEPAGELDSLWQPASLSGWLLLIGAYILLGIVATGGFLATFVVFSGGRLPKFVPDWLGWVAWGFAGLLAVLILAGWGLRLLRRG